MPLLLRKNIADETSLSIWKIEETPEWFKSQLKLDDRELLFINSVKHPKRKLHWLSSRMLLRLLLNNPEILIQLEMDENGKPVVKNFPVNISISHSADLSALMLSEKNNVGIDIEKMDDKIKRIQNKFLRIDELKNISPSNSIEHMYVYWCAKEAMYKWHGRKQLDFKEHLFVEPFEYSVSGKMKCEIRKNDFSAKLEICYEKVGEYMMAYVIGE
jgi:phosphopantetheinyl transferase